MSTAKVLAWGVVGAIIAVIVFVRAGSLGGQSGGEQASSIINSTTSGFGKVINAAQGYQV